MSKSENDRVRELSEMRARATGHVCFMLTESIAGYMNRPDYFRTNDLIVLADLAYLAQVKPDRFLAANDEYNVLSIHDVVIGLQQADKAEKWYALLNHCEERMCDLAPYEKYRFSTAEHEGESSPLIDESLGASEPIGETKDLDGKEEQGSV